MLLSLRLILRHRVLKYMIVVVYVPGCCENLEQEKVSHASEHSN